jgi:hypothetical protein
MAADNSTPDADWYADPADPALHRWWDGSEWTDRLRPAAPLKTARRGSSSRPSAQSAAVQSAAVPSAALVLELPPPPSVPKPATSTRYFGDRPPAPTTGEVDVRDVRSVYEQSREVAGVDLHRIVRNPMATLGIVAGIMTAVGLALFQYVGVPFTYLFAPSVVALSIAGIAAGRARLTGAGVVRSVVALLLAGPLTAVTVWAFAEQLVDVIPLAG